MAANAPVAIQTPYGREERRNQFHMARHIGTLPSPHTSTRTRTRTDVPMNIQAAFCAITIPDPGPRPLTPPPSASACRRVIDVDPCMWRGSGKVGCTGGRHQTTAQQALLKSHDPSEPRTVQDPRPLPPPRKRAHAPRRNDAPVGRRWRWYQVGSGGCLSVARRLRLRPLLASFLCVCACRDQ